MKDTLSRLKVYSDGFKNKGALRNYKELRNLYPNIPEQNTVVNCIVSENIEPALGQLDTILKDVYKMIGYDKNNTAIINYFDYVISYIAGAEGFSENIETNWRLTNERQQRKMAVL